MIVVGKNTMAADGGEDYTGAFCLLHGLTPTFPKYQEILVDTADYEWLITQVWRLANVGSRAKSTRAVRKDTQYLAILLMNPPSGMVVDHKNHRPLDNRRNNLRVCTQGENAINVRRQKNGTSRFKGVHLCARSGKWRVQCGTRAKRVFLGHYDDEVAAARAYNEFAKREYGEFACLNPV